MVSLVLGAFLAARFTDIGAQFTDLLCKLAASCHRSRSHSAYGSAVNIKGDTMCHHFYVIFSKARSEERRVGKECKCRGSREHEKKKKKNSTISSRDDDATARS